MRIEIRGHGMPVTRRLHHQVEQRLWVALSRFGSHIESVKAGLIDLPGDHGRLDKGCQVQVRGRGKWSVLVLDRHATLMAAVNQSAERAQRCVERALLSAGAPGAEEAMPAPPPLVPRVRPEVRG